MRPFAELTGALDLAVFFLAGHVVKSVGFYHMEIHTLQFLAFFFEKAVEMSIDAGEIDILEGSCQH